jgi:class 3 adenylate cyclase
VLELAELLPDAEVVESPRADTLFFVGETAPVIGELLLAATGRRHAPATRRRLLAVLLHDLVDSTALAAQLGDLVWRDRLDAHDGVVRDVLAVHGGTLVKHTGDGALATFELPSAAVAAATLLLARLDGLGLRARAGLHLGEVEVRGDDIGGLAVHVAARVLDAADAGQVLTTSTIRTATLGTGQSFGDPATQRLRGVPGSWELAAVAD